MIEYEICVCFEDFSYFELLESLTAQLAIVSVVKDGDFREIIHKRVEKWAKTRLAHASS